jgi:ABC-2 type transport system permease protein
MNAFAGTAALLRLALRRDRVLIGVWLAVFVAMAAFSASATVDLYPTLASRLEAAETLNRSQSLVALYGRVYDPTSLGAIAMIKLGGFGAGFVALLSIMLVVRHTRRDEEAGRTELVGATAAGRRAPLTAALAEAALVNAALAALTAAGLTATGLPIDGSAAFGLAWGGVGLAFAAIAAVAAQVASTARGAKAVSLVVLAAVYVLRAVGDAADETGPRWLSWLSPIGWGQQFRPYAGNRFWVLAITLAFTATVVAVSLAIVARRDLGSGVLPDRPGPAQASPRLATPLALAWRLHRGSLAGWAVGFALVGSLMGSLASQVGGFLTSEDARDLFAKLGGEKAVSDMFLSVELAFAGIVAAAFGIHVVMRLHAEETEGRAEPVLATAVSRLRWAAGHLAVAAGGTMLLLAITGFAAGVAHGAATGDLGQTWRVLAGALAQAPAAWVVVGIAVAAFGLAPRYSALGWAALVAFVLLAEIGPLLELSSWVMDLSPFAHAPKLPGGTVESAPLVSLVAVAVALAAAGLAGLRHRDVA